MPWLNYNPKRPPNPGQLVRQVDKYGIPGPAISLSGGSWMVTGESHPEGMDQFQVLWGLEKPPPVGTKVKIHIIDPSASSLSHLNGVVGEVTYSSGNEAHIKWEENSVPKITRDWRFPNPNLELVPPLTEAKPKIGQIWYNDALEWKIKIVASKHPNLLGCETLESGRSGFVKGQIYDEFCHNFPISTGHRLGMGSAWRLVWDVSAASEPSNSISEAPQGVGMEPSAIKPVKVGQIYRTKTGWTVKIHSVFVDYADAEVIHPSNSGFKSGTIIKRVGILNKDGTPDGWKEWSLVEENTMSKFKTGTRVWHAKYGEGTIASDEANGYFDVWFNEGILNINSDKLLVIPKRRERVTFTIDDAEITGTFIGGEAGGYPIVWVDEPFKTGGHHSWFPDEYLSNNRAKIVKQFLEKEGFSTELRRCF